MKKLNKKGFTLIELLATIVILGVLMTIAIVSYNAIINDSKKTGFTSSAQSYLSAAKDMFMLKGALYADGNYYVDIHDIELEKGGKSPYGGDYRGYILLQTTSNTGTTTNTYKICIDDSQGNNIELGLANKNEKIENGSVKYTEGKNCGTPSTETYPNLEQITLD